MEGTTLKSNHHKKQATFQKHTSTLTDHHSLNSSEHQTQLQTLPGSYKAEAHGR
jgi:hypothetical protein